jgi:hypothetical protein
MEFTIDVPEVTGYMSSFWDIVRRKKPPYEERIKTLLENSARNDHRYVSRTGNLERATKTKGTLDKEINLYVDQGKAPYAKYVVNRRGTWKGDPFIEDAGTENSDKVRKIIQELYDDSIAEWNNK